MTKSSTKIPYDIPVEGSLGLLALGAVGVTEWKKVRQAHAKANAREQEEKEKESE